MQVRLMSEVLETEQCFTSVLQGGSKGLKGLRGDKTLFLVCQKKVSLGVQEYSQGRVVGESGRSAVRKDAKSHKGRCSRVGLWEVCVVPGTQDLQRHSQDWRPTLQVLPLRHIICHSRFPGWGVGGGCQAEV